MDDTINAIPRANHYIDKNSFIQTLIFDRGFADFVIVESRKFNKYYVICKKNKFLIKELLVCILVIIFISFMLLAPPYSLEIRYKILIAVLANTIFLSFFMTLVVKMLKKMPFLPILTIDCAESRLVVYRRRNIDLVQIEGDKFSIAFSKIDSIQIVKTTRFLQSDGLTNWGSSRYIKFIYLKSGNNSNLFFITTYGPSTNKIIKLIVAKVQVPIISETRNYMERYAIDRDTGIINENALKCYSRSQFTRKKLFILLGIALVFFIIFSLLFLFIDS